MPSDQFDLLVLGAGPAGATAAKTAADAGLRVALIDRASFPRDKLCGGGLTGRAMSTYRTAYGAEALDAEHLSETCVEFHAFGASLGRHEGGPPFVMTMRRTFDATLVARALAAGATDFTGCKPTAIDPVAPSVTLASGRCLTAPCLIGADGVTSPTARAIWGRAYDPAEVGFALEAELPVTDRPLRIDFGAAEWGYGWQFPKPCGTTVGIGGVHARNPRMKAAMTAYLDRLGLPDAPVKGAFLPFGAARRTPGQGAVLLAGDAAGLVDPITGEGIGHAMESGRLAALAIRDALHEGHPTAALPRYTKRLHGIHKSMRIARLIRPYLFHPRLRPGFVAGFRGSQTLRADYFRLMGGELEYGDLARKMLMRLPKLIRLSLTSRTDTQEIAAPPP